jgi:hypothetical protein
MPLNYLDDEQDIYPPPTNWDALRRQQAILTGQPDGSDQEGFDSAQQQPSPIAGGMRIPAGNPQPAPQIPLPAPDPVELQRQKAQQARQGVTDLAGKAPVQQKPTGVGGVLRGIAAAGLGAAAGYSNAAGRTRQPIDVSGITNTLVDPGLKRRQVQYQQQMTGAQAKQAAEEQNLKDLEQTQLYPPAQAKVAEQERQRRQQIVNQPEFKELSPREKVEFIESGKMPTIPAQRKPTALDLQQRAHAILSDPDAEESDKAAAQGFIDQQKRPTNLTKQWVTRPNSEEPEMAFVDPRNPKGYIDSSGSPMPDGTKSVATPTQQRLYGQVQGYYYYFRGQGIGDQEARQKAGEMFVQREGAQLGRLQQQSAIDGALSGIGMGPGFGGMSAKPTPQTPPPQGGGTPASKAVSPRIGTPTVAPQEDQNIGMYLGSLMGNMPTQGGKASAVRVQNGMTALARRTGLDPMALNAELTENKGLAKSLNDSLQVAGAFGRVQETLKAHGQVLLNAAKDVTDSGIKVGNQSIRWIQENIGPHPELQKYNIAIAALQREYARLIAGGVQSRAMLPVSSESEGQKILNPNVSLKDLAAAVQQLTVEADTEQLAFQRQAQEIKNRLTKGPVGQAASGGGRGGRGDQQQAAPDATITMKLKDGRTGEIHASQLQNFLRDNPGSQQVK